MLTASLLDISLLTCHFFFFKKKPFFFLKKKVRKNLFRSQITLMPPGKASQGRQIRLSLILCRCQTTHDYRISRQLLSSDKAQLPHYDVGTFLPDHIGSICCVGAHISWRDAQVDHLQILDSVHVQLRIHHATFFARSHLARAETMPRCPNILPQILLDRLIVFGIVR